jgi:hypothetical protein
VRESTEGDARTGFKRVKQVSEGYHAQNSEYDMLRYEDGRGKLKVATWSEDASGRIIFDRSGQTDAECAFIERETLKAASPQPSD